MELPTSWIWFAPLAAVWLVRWSALFGTRLAALAYRPARPAGPRSGSGAENLSVVVLAGEGTATLRRAVESWLVAGVRRVIVLVGAEDVAAQRIIERYPVHVLRRRPSDRASLRAGWQVAVGECVALTRADAVWMPDTSRHAVAAFADRGVGGVSVRENISGRGILARLVDMELDLRALDGAPAASLRGAVTRWGGTAVFRRSVLSEVGADFVAEPDDGWAGDVEDLAHLVLDAGHGLVHQRPARTWRPPPGPAGWLTARLAADRAGARIRGRALTRRRTWRRPGLALAMLAWLLAGPAALVGPAWLVAALAFGWFDVALVLLAVACFEQFVLLLPHLRRRPTSLAAVPVYALYGTASGLIRLAALVPAVRRAPARPAGADVPAVIDPALRLQPVRPRRAPDATPVVLTEDAVGEQAAGLDTASAGEPDRQPAS